jgi:hypothetical protein
MTDGSYLACTQRFIDPRWNNLIPRVKCFNSINFIRFFDIR